MSLDAWSQAFDCSVDMSLKHVTSDEAQDFQSFGSDLAVTDSCVLQAAQMDCRHPSFPQGQQLFHVVVGTKMALTSPSFQTLSRKPEP
jgi:hypothetical protein